ncbi:MAG: gliding motility-associated C-terminal domain-containing protein [Salibacteraceae bacterium]
MKRFFLALLTIALCLGAAKSGLATHFAGTDLQYKCIGTDSFEITLNLFRDCSGNPAPLATDIDFVSSCGGVLTVNVPLTAVDEVSQLCEDEIVNSTCNGGTFPGMEQYIYRTTVVLTPPCNTWTVSWRDCCRNTSQNATGQPWMYNRSTMYTASFPCNNSPEFNAQPIPYVCIFQTVNYNFSVFEPDGDSVVYKLVPGLTNAGPLDTLPYTSPYTSSSPLTGIVLDTQTGQLTFTPTIQGNWIIVVEVEEYDPITGQLKGSVRRDIQVIVQTCTNNQPTFSGISNLSTNVSSPDPNSVEACYGDFIYFEVDFSDIDLTDTLDITSNITQLLPGATFNVVGAQTNQKTAQISWLAQPGTPSFNSFSIQVSDGDCPVPGLLSTSFDITVFNSVYAGEDTAICGSNTQSAQLQGVGAPILNWSVISGPPMVVGTGPGANFSCNPCDNPVATPIATTTYLLSGPGYTGPCDSLDTVTVFVAPNYDLVMPSDTIICHKDTIPLLTGTTPPTSNISWSWDQAGSLDDSTLQNPLASPNTTTVFTLTATSAAGCIKSDDVTIQVPTPVPPIVQAITSDSILCLGTPGQLSAQLGTLVPEFCGVNPNGCLGTVSQVIVGNGTVTNTLTTYPSILGNFFEGARHQYLYTAADLNAAGFTGGGINGLAFFVVGTPNQTQFQQFEIKIGCAGLSNLNSFQTGLTTVFPAQTITANAGWNQFNFSQVYDYDGSSDLIVEFCFSNGNFTNNGNARIRYTNTTYNSTLHLSGDDPAICSNNATPISTNSRVNLRFSVCSGANPLAYNYQWTPGTLLNDPSAQNPTMNPVTVGNYAYQVIIQDTFGACIDTTDTLPIQVVDTFDASITSSSPYCFSGGIDTLVAATGGGTWTGNGITNSSSGFFDPAIAGIGSHVVQYTITGNCASQGTAVIVVAPSPNTSINNPGPLCVLDNSVQLSAVVPGGTWGGHPNLSASGIFDPSAAGVGTHTITYSVDSVCNATGTHQITVISGLVSTIGNNPDRCVNALPSNLNIAPGADPGGTWSGPGITNTALGSFDPSIAGVGSHTITYTHAGSCGSSNSITLNVFALPSVEVTGILPEYCDNYTALVTPSGGTPSGVWSGFGGINPNSGAFVPSSITGTGPHTIVYTVTDVNQCSAADNFTFQVFPAPPVPSPVSTSQPYCETELIDDLQATQTGANTIQWYSDPGLTNLLAEGLSYDAGTASSTFTLYLTQTAPAAQGGCVSDVLPLNVQVIPNPTPSFTATPESGVGPLSVNFTNTTQPVNGFTYDWDFKNGNLSSAVNPNEIFVDFGTYPVTLVATDAFGCQGSFSKNIVVEVNIETFIPNVFTPNGDLENDAFGITVLEGETAIQSLEGEIFNRWGRKIAQLSNAKDVWDGGNSEDGVYFYVVNIIAVDGSEYRLNGHVTLLRNP